MSFATILSRGFAAANRIPTALLLYLLILGLPQGMNIVVGGLFSPDVFQMEPGEAPSPALMGLVAFGCFSCVWSLAAVFAAPWVTGGVLGQLRDRMNDPPNPTEPLAVYGGRFYGRMLVLSLIWLALFAVIMVLLGLVGAAIAATEIEPGQPVRPEQWQRMNLHPANIASGIVFFSLITLMGVVWSLAQAIVVLDGQGPLASLGEAIRFCKRHKGDFLKLYLVSAVAALPLWSCGPLLAALGVQNLVVRAVLGLLIAIYFAYIIMLALGWAMSLCLARRREEIAETTPRPALA